MTGLDVRIWKTAEYVLVLVGFLLMTEALNLVFNPVATTAANVNLTDSNPRKLIVTILVFGLSTFFIVRRPALVKPMIRKAWPLFIVAVLPVLSVIWSILPDITLRRSIAHVLTFAFCLYLATRHSPQEILHRIYVALMIGCTISVALAIAVPKLGTVQGAVNTGAWIGLFGDKIFSGIASAVALLLSFIIPIRHPLALPIRLGCMAICSLLLIMSESRTGWLTVLIGLMMLFVIHVMSMRRVSSDLRIASATLLGGGVILFLVGLVPVLIAASGRTMTFSGRTKLWNAAIQVASGHNPWLGYGYRAFWTEEGAMGVRAYIMNWGRLPGNGHNGYLDTWLELGWIGAIVLLLLLLGSLVTLVKKIVVDPGNWAWTALMVLLLSFLLNNMAFSLAFKHSNLSWAVVFLIGLCAARPSASYQPVYVPAPTGPRAPFWAPRGGRYA